MLSISIIPYTHDVHAYIHTYMYVFTYNLYIMNMRERERAMGSHSILVAVSLL